MLDRLDLLHHTIKGTRPFINETLIHEWINIGEFFYAIFLSDTKIFEKMLSDGTLTLTSEFFGQKLLFWIMIYGSIETMHLIVKFKLNKNEESVNSFDQKYENDKIECLACAEDIFNQQAHYGGCIPYE